MDQAISFASAYRQLRPSEKAFVDSYVQSIEREAERANERISNALFRPIPGDVVEASRGMLDKPLVRAAITERINTLATETELTISRVVKELMGISFSSIGNYMEIGEDGYPHFDFTRCTPEQLAAVQSVEFEETPGRNGMTRKFKFKLHDKLGAIDKLGKYMGMLDADNPHWRASNARPIGPAALPDGVTQDAAAEAYARLING